MAPGSPEKSSEDGSQKELRRLVEAYAMRAREFYEGVAALGAHLAAGRSLEAAVSDVKKLRSRCEEAGGDLFGFMMSHSGGASFAGGTGSRPTKDTDHQLPE